MKDTTRTRPRGFAITAALLLITAVATLIFWVTFFVEGEAQTTSFLAQQCAGWYTWERSFPVADTWMALTCFIGALGLLRMRPWGLLFCALAGSALIFLGLIDVLFFLQNGLYAHLRLDVVIEMVIHAWTLGLGTFVIVYTWSQRHLLRE
jgi:hypothetical protein